ncbi:DUF4112 domain-containing protein [Gimesia fumaroli]|uniref:DUF4112 domain-containing protein n=1 Tax=Gimesia fumaroli TaxID=2527976 RepID=A0A518IAM4_9PLAN|nr:DUF4112 domain-containing protein [Gimesia fumaroli]QDV50070.1 hypothetical protein Enr17x_21060 [Gimesia fumaroli]
MSLHVNNISPPLTRKRFKPAIGDSYHPERSDRMARFEQLTHFLDDAFRVPGTNLRIGWDTLIGIVPGLGDMISATLSGYLIYEAKQLGASRWVLARMVGNVALDSLIGAIPLLGDVFDAFFKSNRRNSRLLKKHLNKRNTG